MIFILENALSPQELQNVVGRLDQENFVDGRQTIGRVRRDIKNNRELPVGSRAQQELTQLIAGALFRHPSFQHGVMPHTVTQFLFSRYEPGMNYGDHIDDPILGSGGSPVRSDMSITVFLNQPTDYDGGELVINSDSSPEEVKLAAGDAVVYPTTSIHRVNPVTRGVRRVAVAWIQSMIRDDAHRQIAWDLRQALAWVSEAEEKLGPGDPDAYRLIQKCRANLLRMWVDV